MKEIGLRIASGLVVASLIFAGGQPASAKNIFESITDGLNKVNQQLDKFQQQLPGPNQGGVFTPQPQIYVPQNNGYGQPPVAPSVGSQWGGNPFPNPGGVYPGGGYTPDPSNQVSEKALEAMAALGDPWARLKLEEIRNRRQFEFVQYNYQQTSWWNIFKKLSLRGDLSTARDNWERAATQLQQYEIMNPNHGGNIVTGIDGIGNIIDEWKALFGNKKAAAKLELDRAQKAYNQIYAQYQMASWTQKLQLKNQLDQASYRLRIAQENYNRVVNGQNPAWPTGPGAGTSNPGTYPGQPGVVFPSSGAPNNNAAMQFMKDRMDAAYQRYVTYMSGPNPNPSTLAQYKRDYEISLEEYRRIGGR